MDLITAAERIASMDRSPLKLKTDSCLHALDKLATCEACFNICPAEAIKPGKPPSLNVDKCQTCLACLTACPVGAYTAVDIVPPLLKCVTRANVKSIELICEVHPEADHGPPGSELAIQTRGCLASLGTGTYLILLALGLETISIRLDACNQCPWESLQVCIKEQLAAAKHIQTPWDYSEKLVSILDGDILKQVERPLWRAENPPVSRRDLFRLSSYIAQPEILQSLFSEQSQIGNHRLSQDRRRIIAALTHLPEIEADNDTLLLDKGDFVEISISDACTACGVCARACPTSALEFKTENNAQFWLLFTPQACIACDICAQICPENVIQVNSKPSFDYVFRNEAPIVLYAGDLTRCLKCNALMSAKSGSKLCSICEFRHKNPFGSSTPPGYKPPLKIPARNENDP
jgi:ferredoxin